MTNILFENYQKNLNRKLAVSPTIFKIRQDLISKLFKTGVAGNVISSLERGLLRGEVVEKINADIIMSTKFLFII